MAEEKTQKLLDLTKGEGGIQAKANIGPVVSWHGSDVDLRKVPEALANKMADEKGTRYVTRTGTTPAAKAEARAASAAAGQS